MRQLGAIVVLVGLGCAAVPPPGLPEATPTPATAALATPTPVPVSDPVPTGRVVFTEDFERPDALAAWELPAASQPTTWRLLRTRSCNGWYAVWLGQAGGEEPFLTTPGTHTVTKKAPLDLVGLRRPLLKYDIRGRTYPAEAVALAVEVQPPGGAWQPVGRQVRGEFTFAASITADLTPFAGQAVGLRFVAKTGQAAIPSKGFYLDDIALLEPS